MGIKSATLPLLFYWINKCSLLIQYSQLQVCLPILLGLATQFGYWVNLDKANQHWKLRPSILKAIQVT